MTAQSIACGTCAAEVPYGRLSCPSCGELLASVEGGRRAAAKAVARPSEPDVLYDAGAAPTAAVVEGRLALESTKRDLDAELPWASASIDVDGGARDDVALDDADGLDGLDDGVDSSLEPTDAASSTGGPAWAVGGSATSGGPTPSYMPRPAFLAAPPEPAFAGPGAYVPPAPVATVPAGPPAPARAWAGHAPERNGRSDVSETDRSAAAPDRTIDGARLVEFVGWLSVAGGAFSAVGFLLPWGLVVIGSSGTEYFDRWGLAGPAHIFVALAVLAVLALGLIRNDIPAWIRTGLAGLGLGALLLGLVWPYMLGPLGTGPGSLIVMVGAAALAVSGVLALIADRHAGVDRSV